MFVKLKAEVSSTSTVPFTKVKSSVKGPSEERATMSKAAVSSTDVAAQCLRGSKSIASTQRDKAAAK
jgi:hypothetical protein